MAQEQLRMARTLIGKKIVMARYLLPTEKEKTGFDHVSDPVLIIILQDNTQMIVQSDPVGNGAGRLAVINPDNTEDLF